MRRFMSSLILALLIGFCGVANSAPDHGLLEELTRYRQLTMKLNGQQAKDMLAAENEYQDIYKTIMIVYMMAISGRDLEKTGRDNVFLGDLYGQLKVFFMPFELQFGNARRAALNSKREMFVVFDLTRWKKFSFRERALLILTEISRFRPQQMTEEQRYDQAAEMLRAFYAVDSSIILKYPYPFRDGRAMRDKFVARIDLKDAYQRQKPIPVITSLMSSFPDSEKMSRDFELAKKDIRTDHYLTNFISISDPQEGRSYLYLLDADHSIFKINQCLKSHQGIVKPSAGTVAFDPKWADYCQNRVMMTQRDNTLLISRKSKVVTSCDYD
jgi:hypothetical protein